MGKTNKNRVISEGVALIKKRYSRPSTLGDGALKKVKRFDRITGIYVLDAPQIGDAFLPELLMNNLPGIANKTATLIAELKKTYNVEVLLLKTDAEYYAPETALRMAREKVFFISEENPESTAKITGLLIEYREALKENRRTNLQGIRDIRYEKAQERGREAFQKIHEIITEYEEQKGKKANPNRIATILNERGIPSPANKGKWSRNTVDSILRKVALPDR